MQADFAALDLNRSYSARSSDDSLRGEDAASSIAEGSRAFLIGGLFCESEDLVRTHVA